MNIYTFVELSISLAGPLLLFSIALGVILWLKGDLVAGLRYIIPSLVLLILCIAGGIWVSAHGVLRWWVVGLTPGTLTLIGAVGILGWGVDQIQVKRDARRIGAIAVGAVALLGMGAFCYAHLLDYLVPVLVFLLLILPTSFSVGYNNSRYARGLLMKGA